MARGRVTIRDVADRAGVSVASVSNAFNEPARLRATTVERIVRAARDLGYAPNPHARALHSRRVGVIGVLFPQPIASVFANPFYASLLEGLGTVTDEQGMSLLTLSPLESSLERAIASAPVDGLVIIGLDEGHAELAPLRKRGVPYVMVDGDAESASSVNVDDEGGAFAAADALLSRGHRDVLVLTFHFPPEEDGRELGVRGRRLRGYRRAFSLRGLVLDESRLVRSLVTIEDAAEVFGRVWDAGMRPTAVLAASDVMALGALRAARRRGIDVPEDLEVIGFDDIPEASLARPALSTVRQPIAEKGRRAAELLVSAIAEGGPPRHVVLPTELVERETTRGRKGER